MAKRIETSPAPQATIAEVQGTQQAYDLYIAQAMALNADEVIPMRSDPSLAYYNVQIGVTAVLPHETRIQLDLPKADTRALASLPNLASAVAFAARAVDGHVASPGTTHQQLSAARSLRAILMASADAVAAKGLVPQAEVDRIHKGSGPIDTANDLLDLSALFQKHPDALAKTPLTQGDLDRADELGKGLLAVLKPENAPKGKIAPADLKTAVDVRNRLWTLLVRGHDQLQRVACWLFGPVEFLRQAPSLHAHAGVRPNRAERASAKAAKDQARATARAAKDKARAEKKAAREKAKADARAAKDQAKAIRQQAASAAKDAREKARAQKRAK